MMNTVNLGTHFGNGYTAVDANGNYTSGVANSSIYSNIAASSSAIQKMTRDIASGYSADIEKIARYANQGDIDTAIAKYQELLNKISVSCNQYRYSLTEGQIETILSNAYETVTGMDSIEHFTSKTASSFWAGVAQGIPVVGLLVQKNSDQEVMAKMDKEDVKFSNKLAEGTGSLLSGAATGAAAGAAIGAAGGPAGALTGAGIGAAVGAAVGVLQLLGRTIFG